MVTQRQAPKAAARSTDKDKHENLSLAEKRLLSKILNESVPGKGTDAVAFRARHAAQMQRLDALQAQRWLTRDGDRYRLPLATLPVLGSPKSKALVADGTRIFRHLVARYRAVPRSAVRVSTLAADSRLDESRVREALSYMLEAPWYAGHSTDLFSGPVDETSVTPGEEVVRRSSWKAWLQERQRQRTIEMRAHSEWNGGVASNFLQASAPIPDSRTKRSESLTPTLADWRKHLPPRIRHAFDEVLQAKQSDLRWLAAIGLRGIVEIVTVTALGRDVPTFKKKLELLHESRYLSDSDIRTLEAVIEVGNASAHRGHKPSAHDFQALLDIVEQLLRRLYVFESAAARARRRVPPRGTTSSRKAA